MKKIMLVAAAAAIAVSAAQAHHSFAMFDATKAVTLKGTVVQFQWTNPHSWVELQVPDRKGTNRNWSIETSSPLVLKRQGWSRSVIKPGDPITIVIRPRKDGTAGGSLVSLTTPDGRTLLPAGNDIPTEAN